MIKPKTSEKKEIQKMDSQEGRSPGHQRRNNPPEENKEQPTRRSEEKSQETREPEYGPPNKEVPSHGDSKTSLLIPFIANIIPKY